MLEKIYDFRYKKELIRETNCGSSAKKYRRYLSLINVEWINTISLRLVEYFDAKKAGILSTVYLDVQRIG